jgi:hypothetical protein
LAPFIKKYQNTVLPVITTDCLLKGCLPRVLCSTETGMPTIPVLPGSDDAGRCLVPFTLLGMKY